MRAQASTLPSGSFPEPALQAWEPAHESLSKLGPMPVTGRASQFLTKSMVWKNKKTHVYTILDFCRNFRQFQKFTCFSKIQNLQKKMKKSMCMCFARSRMVWFRKLFDHSAQKPLESSTHCVRAWRPRTLGIRTMAEDPRTPVLCCAAVCHGLEVAGSRMLGVPCCNLVWLFASGSMFPWVGSPKNT